VLWWRMVRDMLFLDAILARLFDSDSLTLALVVHVCADCVYPVLLARFRSS
jgi:hypothetical protein